MNRPKRTDAKYDVNGIVNFPMLYDLLSYKDDLEKYCDYLELMVNNYDAYCEDLEKFFENESEDD